MTTTTLWSIDETFRPRGHQAVVTIVLDGRAVLYHEESGELVELDELATTVWGCFDGATSVAALARELADVSGADRRAVGEDLVGFCRDLACSDLLDGLTLDAPELVEVEVEVEPAGGPPLGVASEAGGDVALEEIDLRFVPRPRPQVVTREVAGQALLLDGVAGTVCALDPLASVIWRCFDGHGDLAGLVGELARLSDAQPDVVADDVLDLTTDLATLGLLHGVAPPTGAGPGPGPAPGDVIDLSDGTDLDGQPVDGDRLGGSLLVVNWNPGCGYCAAVAPELAPLVAPLADQATELVLVTTGSRQANQAMLAAAGLSCLVVRPGPVEPAAFLGAGTPVACLVEEGRVTGPAAVGSGEVAALARRLAGRDDDPAAAEDGVRYRRDGLGGVCGVVGRARPPRRWATTLTCRVDDYHLGIRVDTPAAARLLAQGLGDRCVAPDPRVPANYSVVLGDPAEGSSRDLRLLLAGEVAVVRSRSSRRVLMALAAHLSSWLAGPDEGLLATTSLAIVSGDQAVLVPPSLAGSRDRLQPRLARLGYAFVDQRLALVDPERAELVVPESRIAIHPEVLAELAESPASRFEAPTAKPGRYRLRAWTTRLGHPHDSHPHDSHAHDSRAHRAAPSPAARLAAALDTVEVEPAELDATAGVLLDLFDQVPLVALDESRADDLVARLTGAFA